MFHAPFTDLNNGSTQMQSAKQDMKHSTKKLKILNQIKANNQMMRNNGDLSHLADPGVTTQYLVSNGGSSIYGSTGYGGLGLAGSGLTTIKKDATMSNTKSKGSFAGPQTQSR
jgi:hypothetical protein